MHDDHWRDTRMVGIRPFATTGPLVRLMTEAIVTTLSCNFAVHVQELDAVVRISPPRGKGKPFATVRKETWLGGVLDAH